MKGICRIVIQTPTLIPGDLENPWEREEPELETRGDPLILRWRPLTRFFDRILYIWHGSFPSSTLDDLLIQAVQEFLLLFGLLLSEKPFKDDVERYLPM